MLPEERADSFLRMIRRAERGRLKIYLGYCPGVGKTYQMLLEGHRLKEEGIDVAIGYLQKRLKEGKIYKADRVETAMSNFFRTSNLEKLREMTLREMASQIDPRRREALVADCCEVELDTVLASIAKREELGSTFLNEGVALPHARIEKLLHPVVAVGLTRNGVSDVATEKPIEYVFLILSPAESPESQIWILGQVSRASRNRQLVRSLESCRTPEEAFTAIRAWEALQHPGAAGNRR